MTITVANKEAHTAPVPNEFLSYKKMNKQSIDNKITEGSAIDAIKICSIVVRSAGKALRQAAGMMPLVH